MLFSMHELDASPLFARPDNAVQEEFIQEFPAKLMHKHNIHRRMLHDENLVFESNREFLLMLL